MHFNFQNGGGGWFIFTFMSLFIAVWLHSLIIFIAYISICISLPKMSFIFLLPSLYGGQNTFTRLCFNAAVLFSFLSSSLPLLPSTLSLSLRPPPFLSLPSLPQFKNFLWTHKLNSQVFSGLCLLGAGYCLLSKPVGLCSTRKAMWCLWARGGFSYNHVA